MKNIDVLCIGTAAYDITMSIPHHPSADEKTVAHSMLMCGGGPAANAAVTASRLGCTSAYAGYVGSDLYGDELIEEFSSEGVVTDYVVRGDSPTSVSVILVKPDGLRSIVHYRGLREGLAADSVDFSTVKPAAAVFDGHEPDISMSFIKEARKRGVPTILDAGSVRRGTTELISSVDIVICSEKFAHDFTNESDETMALTKLNQFSNKVIITLGKKGCIWKSESSQGVLSAYNVEAIDTTGAGDTFHGAFAACVANGENWDYSLRFSSAAAALCCTRHSGRGGIPSREQVLELLKKVPDQ